MTATATGLLGALVGDERRFLDEYWQRQPLHRPGAAGDSSPFRLTLADVVGAVNNPMLRAPFFLMSKDGEPVPAARITRTTTIAGVQVTDLIDARAVAAEFEAGATLVLRGAAEQIAGLAEPCGQLAAELGTNVVAHLFLTPSNARGFAWHRDTEDVLVVQVRGRKAWQTAPDRLVSGERGVVPPEEPAFEPEQIREFTLDEGDVLYLPSGCPHRAASLSTGASMHLSLGIKRIEWTRVVNHALMAAIGTLPTYAPLRAGTAEARAWLAELGSTAASLMTETPAPRSWQPPPDELVANVLAAQFPDRMEG